MLVSSCLAGSAFFLLLGLSLCLSPSSSLSLCMSLYPTVSLVPLSVCASPATCNFVCPFCFIFVLSPSLRRAITVDATKAAATGDPQQQAAVLAACRLPLATDSATLCDYVPRVVDGLCSPIPDPSFSSPAAFGILHDKRRGKRTLQGRVAKWQQPQSFGHLAAQTMRMPQRDDVENVAGHVVATAVARGLGNCEWGKPAAGSRQKADRQTEGNRVCSTADKLSTAFAA